MLKVLVLLCVALPLSQALIRPNGVGKLPALGWNSWNAFFCNINETSFLNAAQTLVDLGLKDAGYQYVNIDDCWSVKTGRDSKTGRLVPDPVKFPDGIKGTAAKIHALGLKIGIYSSAGTETCASYPASLGYEKIDAEAWAEWGIDYLKYDNCGVPSNWTDSCNYCVNDRDTGGPNGTCISTARLCPSNYDYSQSKTAERYRMMRDALDAQSRTILYSLCDWGYAGVHTWGNSTGASWRISVDIRPDWGRILEIVNQNSFLMNYVNFWGHNDADMMEIGNGRLTYAQSRTHMALWAAMKSPIIIGTTLSKLSAANLALLKNKFLLAFHQDPVFGQAAAPYKWGTNPDWTFNRSNPAEYWSGKYQNGTLVWMFNPNSYTVQKIADFSEIPGLRAGQTYRVYDAWTGADLGKQRGSIGQNVAAHDTSVLLIK